MAINPRLRELLERRQIHAEVVPHRETTTTQQAAQNTLVAGRHVAKVVVMRSADGQDLMVVVPATFHVDPLAMYFITGRAGIQLEDERELAGLFPDCELGAMPPIGHLYGLETYVDPCLLEDQTEIWFQAGNHHELVRLSIEDFVKIAGPFHGHVCLHRQAAAHSRR